MEISKISEGAREIFKKTAKKLSGNGPHINSHRTQFIKRMTEFADNTGLKIRWFIIPQQV